MDPSAPQAVAGDCVLTTGTATGIIVAASNILIVLANALVRRFTGSQPRLNP